jgi:hypothetical protein
MWQVLDRAWKGRLWRLVAYCDGFENSFTTLEDFLTHTVTNSLVHGVDIDGAITDGCLLDIKCGHTLV